jgi:hypothetical protein
VFAFEGDAADESKHTEEALRRSEAELRDIVDQMKGAAPATPASQLANGIART